MHARSLTVGILLTLLIPTVSRARDEGMAGESAASQEVEEIVVWGVRTGQVAPILGASTDRISVDDFTAENKDLADLLSEVEGVSVRRFGGPGDRAEVSIRGSSPSQVAVTIDGVKANSVLTGGLDLSRVCVPLLDAVEVTRGAGSAQEGSGAVGGVVNLVTRAGEGSPTTRARFDGGAFDTYSGSLLHSGRWNALDYTVGYCGFTTDGDFDFARPVIRSDGFEIQFEPDTVTRINNDREQHGVNLGLGRRFDAGTLRFIDIGSYSSGGEPGIDSGNGETAGQSTEAGSRDLSNLAQLRWEGASPTKWGDAFEVAAYHRYERTSFRNPVVQFQDPIDLKTRLWTIGLLAADTWEWAITQKHSLATKLDFDAAHAVLRSTDRSGRERPNVAGGVTEELNLFSEQLRVAAGARIDWTDGFDVQVLPSLGVVYEPFAWLRLRGQLGRAYRAPNFDELYYPDEGFIRGNPDLSPEDAWNFDAGVELDFAEVGPLTNLRLKATGFYREIDESIVWILINPRTIAPVNTGSAKTSGFEVSASIDWTRYLQVSANHTYTDSERDATGERLAGQPEHETFARLRVGPEKVWKLVAEVQRVGEILINEGGSFRLPERTVWNASASLNLAGVPFLPFDRWTRELWIHAELNNISDEAVRDSISFPQPGRNASAGFEARW